LAILVGKSEDKDFLGKAGENGNCVISVAYKRDNKIIDIKFTFFSYVTPYTVVWQLDTNVSEETCRVDDISAWKMATQVAQDHSYLVSVYTSTHPRRLFLHQRENLTSSMGRGQWRALLNTLVNLLFL
jgi:hypothetical protein